MTIFQKEPTTLQALAAREIELAGRKRAALETASRAETAAGIAIIDSDEIDAVIAPAIKARAKIKSFDIAISTLRGRRAAVILDVNAKAARSIRDDAGKKQRQMEAINLKTEALLKGLSELQGVEFTTRILESEPTSSLGPLAGCFTPRSMVLKSEIEGLIARASSLESAPVQDIGHIELDAVIDDAEVLHAVVSSATQSPSAETVSMFLGRCARNYGVPDHDFGSRPRRVRIDWENGIITDGYVHCPELSFIAGPVKGTHAPYPAPSDCQRGLFRAVAA